MNCLPADNSHEISSLIFPKSCLRKLRLNEMFFLLMTDVHTVTPDSEIISHLFYHCDKFNSLHVG